MFFFQQILVNRNLIALYSLDKIYGVCCKHLCLHLIIWFIVKWPYLNKIHLHLLLFNALYERLHVPHACILLSSCEDGYTLATQTDSLSCQSDGSWSKHSIQCRPTPCPLPTNVSTPNLVISGRELTPVGGTITLSCPPGFYLQGSALAECQVGNIIINGLSLCPLIFVWILS